MSSEINRIKYPRTMNLPFSDSNSSDDVWWKDCKQFEGLEVVVSEKLDGECSTIYPDATTHARSIDSKHHPSRSWLKQYAATFAHDIPKGCRICGENMFAYHSIFYAELPSYFLVFGAYNEENWCLSWDETEEICEMLGVHMVPVIYRGIWDEKLIRSLWTGKGTYPTFKPKVANPTFPVDFEPCVAEGYVVRVAHGFPHSEFKSFAAKYVRPNHVTTSAHWMEQAVLPNLIIQP